jgi:hypothetical protein
MTQRSGNIHDFEDGTQAIAAVIEDSAGAVVVPLSEGTFTGRVGEVQASPTANTLLARLKDLLSLIVLAAGSNIIGKVGIDQTTPGTTESVTTKTKGYTSGKVSVTRTADTAIYAANDVLGPATGSTAAITFPTMGPSAGGEIIITSAEFERDAAGIIAGETSYTLHLYNITPPSALGDNAAFDLPAGDRVSYLGNINLGTPVDLGSTLYIKTDAINMQVTLASGSLFGYLVTVGTYTPVSAAVHVIALHSVAA